MTNKLDTPLASDGGESRPRVLSSAELLGGQPEIVIQHNGALYRLRITRQDKLILTK